VCGNTLFACRIKKKEFHVYDTQSCAYVRAHVRVRMYMYTYISMHILYCALFFIRRCNVIVVSMYEIRSILDPVLGGDGGEVATAIELVISKL